jgi:PAS domain S-box-containing protein
MSNQNLSTATTGHDELIRILLIEDNPVDVRLITELLKDTSDGRFEVHTARTLSEGLSHLSTDETDVVLLDLGLPDSQGFETFHSVAKQAPHLPVVVLTVLDNEGLARKAVRAGAQDFITKDVLAKEEPYAGIFVRTIRYALERKRAEETLVQAEKRYRVLVETADSIIISMDTVGKITFVNDYGARFFGYTVDELVGQDVSMLVPDVKIAGRLLRLIVNDIIAQPDAHATNLNQNVTKDGRLVWVNWVNKSLVDAEGNRVGLLSIGNDFTEHKYAEDALLRERDRAQQYLDLIDLAQDAIIVRDLEHHALTWNKGARRLFGWTEEEALGRSVPDLISAVFPVPFAEFQARLFAHGRWEGPVQCQTCDGTPLIVESRFTVERDEAGKPTRLLSISSDITAQRQAEAALQEAADAVHELNKLLRTANEALQVANEELEQRVQERTREIVTVNEELRKEVDERKHAQAIANEHVYRISALNSITKAGNTASDVQTALESMLDAALNILNFDAGIIYLTGEGNEVEYRCARGISLEAIERSPYAPLTQTGTGSVYREEPMHLYLRGGGRDFPNKLEAGAVIPLVAKDQAIGHYAVFCYKKHRFSPSEQDLLEIIGQDAGAVIARLRAEEQARRYSEHLEDIVAERTAKLKDAERLAGIGETAMMIGHDLRNPLQGLQYIVDLQKLRFKRVPPEKRGRAEWEKEAKLFDKMSEQIFYMDKIVGDLQDYARPLASQLEVVKVKTLIDDVIASLPRADHVKTVARVGDVEVKVDRHLMRRAFANLVLNAFQAMPDSGTLTISASADDSSASISVKDTGVGIPRGIQDKIFSPLTTGKAKGTGLGLAVVKRIIDAHGGTISFESEAGNGTTFIVMLPLER